MHEMAHVVPLHVAAPLAGTAHEPHDVVPQLVTAMFDTHRPPHV